MSGPSRKKSTQVDPTQEENFPDSPARRAADREMAEPSNLRPSTHPTPKREPVPHEIEDSDD